MATFKPMPRITAAKYTARYFGPWFTPLLEIGHD